MDYEQFKYVENKIIEAAQNHSTEFDEKDWDKMEQLLDKEPRKKPFVWLWSTVLLLLIGTAGIIFFTNKQHPADKALFQEAGKSVQQHASELADNKALSVTQPVSIPSNETTSKTTGDLTYKKEPAAGNQNRATLVSMNMTGSHIYTGKEQRVNTNKSVNITVESDDIFANKKIEHWQKAKSNFNIIPAYAWQDTQKTDMRTDNEPANTAIIDTKMIKPVTIQAKDNLDPTGNDRKTIAIPNTVSKIDHKNNSGKKKSTPLSSKLFFIASLGADNANVSLLSFTKSQTRARLGLGMGYQFNDRLGLQSGLFLSRKVYQAGPNDYNSKSTQYWQTVQLLQVNANCLVYEIPITVSYKFAQHKKLSYYTSVGVSSYVMKTEDYQYEYIRNNVYHEYDKQYTGNSHFASTLTISAGVEKKLSNKYSMHIEPYIGIPLKGVGDGNVKLYTAGLNAGIKYFPFKLQ